MLVDLVKPSHGKKNSFLEMAGAHQFRFPDADQRHYEIQRAASGNF